jgi:hypothetical protein
VKKSKSATANTGYGLKHLVQYYGVVMDRAGEGHGSTSSNASSSTNTNSSSTNSNSPTSSSKTVPVRRNVVEIRDLFDQCPKHVPVEQKVEWLHYSEKYFRQWVEYSANDAEFTKRLYEKLKDKLQSNEHAWLTEIGAGSLGTEDVVTGSKTASANKSDANGNANNKTATMSHDRPPITRQGTMWDFYGRYYRPFGELLLEMEVTGVCVSTKALDDCLANAQRDMTNERQSFEQRCGNYFRQNDNQRLHAGNQRPDIHSVSPTYNFASKMNLASVTQLQHFLFGRKAYYKIFHIVGFKVFFSFSKKISKRF